MNDDPTLFPSEAANTIANYGLDLASLDADSSGYQDRVINCLEEIVQQLKDNTRQPRIRARLVKLCGDTVVDISYDLGAC